MIGAKTITIYGPGIIGQDGGILDGGTLRIRDVTWNGSPGCLNTATNLPTSTLDIRRSTITGLNLYAELCTVTLIQNRIKLTSGIGVQGEIAGVNGALADRPASLTMERTIVEGGDAGLYVGPFSTTTVRNSIFFNQGTTGGWIAFDPRATAMSSVQFSTFYNSVLRCPNSGTAFFASANNVYVNGRANAPADTASGTGCSHSYDIVSPQATALPGPGNVLNADPAWVNAGLADFRLQSTSAAINAGDPAATEAVDHEGVARPQGGRHDIGAFEYKP